ncbi:MAG TPA: glycosyltransferase [Pyrinomonadaceae bacterium]|nr:glycosyltransferase [Pyrinomonadaceae bacterium]
MSDPLVTVIIPTYNRRNWIGECLDSIRAQTYTHVETLVIDDGSTDGTVEWLRSEPRYSFAKLHVQPVNGGASVARNDGIRMARGELIVFIDSDDALDPRHVETAVSIFREHPQTGLFCCDSTMIGPDGEVLLGGRTWHEVQSELKHLPVRSGFRELKDIFVFSNCFPGFTLPREVFERVGYFDQSLFPMDDYDLALRVAGGGYGVYYCHRPLALRREHTGQCSGFANSVKTCLQQIATLSAAAGRNAELRDEGGLVRRRMAEARMELAVSRIIAGERAGGLGTMLRAVASDPAQALVAARLGGRRLRRRVRAAQSRLSAA